MTLGSNGDPSTGRSGEFEESFSEVADGVVDRAISHSQCLEFLGRKGPNLLMRNLKDKDTICRMLLNTAENLKVLTPGNEPLPWDVLSMSLWKASLGELINEMKTVEEKCPSLVGNSGVYVLTTSPYAAFLRALAAEINC